MTQEYCSLLTEMTQIETLICQLEKIVNEFGAILNEYGRVSPEANDAYPLFVSAIVSCRKTWLNQDPCRECHIEFSGAYHYSESIYVTASVFNNPDDLEEIETLEKTRISCHQHSK